MGYSFRLAARVLLYAPSHRQDSTYHGLCYTSWSTGWKSIMNTWQQPPRHHNLWTDNVWSRDENMTSATQTSQPLNWQCMIPWWTHDISHLDVTTSELTVYDTVMNTWHQPPRRHNLWTDSIWYHDEYMTSATQTSQPLNWQCMIPWWTHDISHLDVTTSELTVYDTVMKTCHQPPRRHNLWTDSVWYRDEYNVLFNNALNTFYLRLYGVRHMVKDNSDSERGKPLLPHGLLFPISSKGCFICIIPQTG